MKGTGHGFGTWIQQSPFLTGLRSSQDLPGLTLSYRRRFFSQSGPRFFAITLAHSLHRFPASAHVSKRPSTSGYSVRVDLQSGLPPSPDTCNTFLRRLSRQTLHAMHGLFVLEWVIQLVYAGQGSGGRLPPAFLVHSIARIPLQSSGSGPFRQSRHWSSMTRAVRSPESRRRTFSYVSIASSQRLDW